MDVIPRKAEKKKSISMILEGRLNFFCCKSNFCLIFLKRCEEGEGLDRMVEMKRI